MGPGIVHDARSFGDTRPVAGVGGTREDHGRPLSAQRRGQVLGHVEGELRFRVAVGLLGTGGVARLFLAPVPHRLIDVGGVFPVVAVVPGIDSHHDAGQHTPGHRGACALRRVVAVS